MHRDLFKQPLSIYRSYGRDNITHHDLDMQIQVDNLWMQQSQQLYIPQNNTDYDYGRITREEAMELGRYLEEFES